MENTLKKINEIIERKTIVLQNARLNLEKENLTLSQWRGFVRGYDNAQISLQTVIDLKNELYANS